MNRIVLAALLASALSMSACTDDGAGRTDTRELTVLAASSLTDVFADLAEDFEQDHPGASVQLSFGSSTGLAEQAADGAPGDVLATADETSMAVAEEAGVSSQVETFATNELVLVTAPGNPAGVETVADLAGVTWVRCDDNVPCGRVALAVLAANRVDAQPASLEDDARSTLDKVASGEADAALVYATDAAAAGPAVSTVPIPGADDHLTSYVTTVLQQADDEELALAWVDHVLSDEGRAALAGAGFGLP